MLEIKSYQRRGKIMLKQIFSRNHLIFIHSESKKCQNFSGLVFTNAGSKDAFRRIDISQTTWFTAGKGKFLLIINCLRRIFCYRLLDPKFSYILQFLVNRKLKVLFIMLNCLTCKIFSFESIFKREEEYVRFGSRKIGFAY